MHRCRARACRLIISNCSVLVLQEFYVGGLIGCDGFIDYFVEYHRQIHHQPFSHCSDLEGKILSRAKFPELL